MKKTILLSFVLIFIVICITGCATALPYSFADNASKNETATITFVGGKDIGVDLHYFESAELPYPSKNKYWAPVIFPAERPFEITVYVYYSEYDRGKENIFSCPALAAGKNYKLELLIIPEKTTLFGLKKLSDRQEKLVLKDANTGRIFHEQYL